MITKNKLKKDFSIFPNALVEDESLSNEAKLIYMYISSKPETWIVQHADIQRALKIKSRTSMAKYTGELEATGWVTREKLPNGTYNYILNSSKKVPLASPKNEQPSSKNGRPENGQQCPKNEHGCPNSEQNPCPNFSTCQKMDTSNTIVNLIDKDYIVSNTYLSIWEIWQSYLALTQHDFTQHELESIRNWAEFKQITDSAQISATIRTCKRYKLNKCDISAAIDQSIAGKYAGIIDLSPKFPQAKQSQALKHCNSQSFDSEVF